MNFTSILGQEHLHQELNSTEKKTLKQDLKADN